MRGARALPWMIVLAAAALRLYEAFARPLYVDEGLSLHLAGLPRPEARASLYSRDVPPPGFPSFFSARLALRSSVEYSFGRWSVSSGTSLVGYWRPCRFSSRRPRSRRRRVWCS